jgi:hypothetical protein
VGDDDPFPGAELGSGASADAVTDTNPKIPLAAVISMEKPSV